MPTPAVNWLDPFGSWDAAARWSAIAAEWMTKGWKQWLELTTAWPALEPVKAAAPVARHQAVVADPAAIPDPAVVPVQAGTQEARNARALQAQARDSRAQATERSRPTARAAGKRTSPRSASRPQARARATRVRG